MKTTPPCGIHTPRPHAHPLIGDTGKQYRKQCSGRWYCDQCATWFTAPPCHHVKPPKKATP